MTDKAAALSCLLNSESALDYSIKASDDFYQGFKQESLVVNLWLQLQSSSQRSGGLARVQSLMQHQAFDINNPNKVRSVISAFCQQSTLNFHAADGSGYEFLAQLIIDLDQRNPQIASRLIAPLSRWRQLEPQRSQLMRSALEQILQEKLSKDVFEVVSKSLS